MRKKNKILGFGTLLLMFVFVSSCSSDDEVQCPQDFAGSLSTEEEKLVGEWMLTAIVAGEALDLTDDGVDNPSTNLYDQYGACQRDAVYTFGTQRTYLFAEGMNAEDCDSTLENSGTWELVSGTLRLTASCSIQSNLLDFNGDDSEFSFTRTFQITDINRGVIQTEIAFTYTLVE